MRFNYFLISLLFLNMSARAQETKKPQSSVLTKKITCDIYKNLELLQSEELHLTLNQKLKLAPTYDASVYATLKEEHLIVLEAFIPDKEIRIYSEAHLNQKNNKIGLSLWSRESIFDVYCSELSSQKYK